MAAGDRQAVSVFGLPSSDSKKKPLPQLSKREGFQKFVPQDRDPIQVLCRKNGNNDQEEHKGYVYTTQYYEKVDKCYPSAPPHGVNSKAGSLIERKPC